jgi:hypothetical protein
MELEQIADELLGVVYSAEPRFRAVDDQVAGRPVADGKWSRKQILGHLIDSAANNHQRFVRLQLSIELHMPGYEQAGWVRANAYSTRPWSELITLWSAYNRHLAHVIAHINPEHLDNVWVADSGTYDLGFLVTDYLVHLRHHVEQALE